MLTLTPTAAEVVRTLVDQSPGDSGGLRIAASAEGLEGVSLELSLVGEPEATDETIEQSGATVYLDADAAQLLADKLLDAHRLYFNTGLRIASYHFQRPVGAGDRP